MHSADHRICNYTCASLPSIIYLLSGVYAHCGNSYSAGSVEEVDSVRSTSMEAIISLVRRLESEGLECETWGIGSTPSCSRDSDEFRQVLTMSEIIIISTTHLCFPLLNAIDCKNWGERGWKGCH